VRRVTWLYFSSNGIFEGAAIKTTPLTQISYSPLNLTVLEINKQTNKRRHDTLIRRSIIIDVDQPIVDVIEKIYKITALLCSDALGSHIVPLIRCTAMAVKRLHRRSAQARLEACQTLHRHGSQALASKVSTSTPRGLPDAGSIVDAARHTALVGAHTGHVSGHVSAMRNESACEIRSGGQRNT
jgi:hypothetical protein